MNSISSNLNIMIKAAEKASKIIIRDFTGNAGQNCVAISRVYINKDIYENFKKIL